MKDLVLRHRRSVLEILLGGLAGFGLFMLTSHPRSHVNKKLPEKRIKNLQVLPSIKYHTKDKAYHLHHWVNMAILYIPILAIRKSILRSKLLHGFFLGSILQGLIYRDRFHVVHR